MVMNGFVGRYLPKDFRDYEEVIDREVAECKGCGELASTGVGVFAIKAKVKRDHINGRHRVQVLDTFSVCIVESMIHRGGLR